MPSIFKCLICDNQIIAPNYGDGFCSKCEQTYIYGDGHSIDLSKGQISLLRQYYKKGSHKEVNDIIDNVIEEMEWIIR